MAESTEKSIFSERLEELAQQIYRGQEPNAGRFCANCYNPLVEDGRCPHCGATGSVDRIPREVLIMIKAKHGREARVVRTIAYGGLLLAMIAASAGLIFISGNWGIAAFILILIGGYFVSALLANSIGDSWGYAYGQKGLADDWQRFVDQRDSAPPTAIPAGERSG
ncbi:MAG TPA: zinc ribbon domain-containing protein [Dehalococcoidia bacterium]|nr:zinc ribbon domain-containing protein [Dehalococcoidia bacterium]